MSSLPALADADREGWADPGVELVAPGVHRIPLPLPSDGLRAVNVYAVAADEGLTLIDGGWAIPAAEEALTTALGDIGFGLGDIRRFLITHGHRDHYTQAMAVRHRLGPRVAVGVAEQPNIAWCHDLAHGGDIERAELPLLRRAGATRLADRVARHPFEPLNPHDWDFPDAWIGDGEPIAIGPRVVTALHTPGHTRGHLVFHDAAAGLLFAGDHVLPHITPSIGFEPIRLASPLRAYLASLALVRSMPDARLLPAHGPATASVHERVDELLAHHAQRLEETLRALEDGADTAYAVAGRLGWTRRHTPLGELDPFNQVLAILETVAHLEVLAERGHLSGTDVDGVRRYRAL